METEIKQTKIDSLDKPLSKWFMLTMPLYVTGFVLLFLLPFAGDWLWLEGWLFAGLLGIHMTIWTSIINRANPRVLRNRMKTKKEGLTTPTRKSANSDRWLMPVMSLTFFGAMIVPAFNYRYGWSTMSFGMELVGLFLVNVGVGIANLAMLQNAYASKILDINQDQKLIDTGLYGKVRHPLYLGFIFMMLATPIALGHWLSLTLGVISALLLVARIKFEEDMLLDGMEGYAEYRERVKYKLIPGIY